MESPNSPGRKAFHNKNGRLGSSLAMDNRRASTVLSQDEMKPVEVRQWALGSCKQGLRSSSVSTIRPSSARHNNNNKKKHFEMQQSKQR